MIELFEISKNFGEKKAVYRITCEIPKGQIFGIVGPDGAGKSTLIRILATVLAPDNGEMKIEGYDVFKNVFFVRNRIAYMPQRFGLYEDLTVEENIYFFGRIFSISKNDIANQLTSLYEFSGLGPYRNRLAGKLSGGMKQKLGLCCCLVHRPEIVLLDEPTNGVDPVSRREFWKILYELLNTKVTIVLSTAYLDEAERCNMLALMYDGMFHACGYPSQIKAMMPYDVYVLSTSDPHSAQRILSSSAQCAKSFVTGKEVNVFIERTRDSLKNIISVLHSNGIKVNNYAKKIPTLEECFLALIEKRK